VESEIEGARVVRDWCFRTIDLSDTVKVL